MTYQITIADVPWAYYGDPNKDAAAGKHYRLMPDEEVLRLDVRSYMAKPALLFVWATCPRLDFAIEAIKAWGLHYRGVAFVWVKTRKNGVTPIGAQGVRASITKPLIELVLVASTERRGRPLRIDNESIAQTVFEINDGSEPKAVYAPRGSHSEKPAEVYRRIERMYPDTTRCELFARTERPGWTCVGDELLVPSLVRTQ